MFFEIGPIVYNPHFSFIIAKHPDSVFDRDLGNGRKVHGRFVKQELEAEKRCYQAYVENDPLTFLNTVRKLNLSNYVHAQLSAVCPHNIKGFDKVFQSALKGKNGSDLTNEEFFTPMMLEATIGPFPRNAEQMIKMFKSVNITAKVAYDRINNPFTKEGNLADCSKSIDAYMLLLSTDQPMSTTEFLQKIYLLSYYNTAYYNLTKISNEQIEKFVVLCKDWLETCEFRNSIINTLCKRNKSLVEKFETTLIKDSEDRVEKLTGLQKYLHKESMHEKKHNFIIEKLRILASKTASNLTLVDLGCGRGQLIKKIIKTLSDVTILGIEADAYKADKARFLFRKGSLNKVITSNVLCPNITESQLLPDILVSIEVIEHLEKSDRHAMLRIIRDLFQPSVLILTTPNIAFNKKFDLAEGELRHKDHKIEYTKEQFDKEVVDYLKEKYKIEYINLFEIENDKEPFSFIIYCTRKESREINRKLFSEIRNMYNPVYLDASNYTIISREISKGFASKQMLVNKDIFYMAPTIAPVEYDPESKQLEHPIAAFKYYRQRGVNYLVAEEKYMGSRSSILIFKELVKAKIMGYNSTIIMNSRQGYSFFDQDDPIKIDIWNDIRTKMDTDFIMLDCEIMPWTLKARKLIEKEFLIPGQCAYLSRRYGSYGNLENAKAYLDVLGAFTKNNEMSIRMFQVLAFGNVDATRKRFCNYVNGLTSLSRSAQYILFNKLQGDIFKPVKARIFSLSDEQGLKSIICQWEDYCRSGGEGYVFKPAAPMVYLPGGYYVQPALKVRGWDYLRLIYGIDYLEKNYFAKVCKRKIKGKRALVGKEFELSLKILQAFLHSNKKEMHRHLAAFIGMEKGFTPFIDATL